LEFNAITATNQHPCHQAPVQIWCHLDKHSLSYESYPTAHVHVIALLAEPHQPPTHYSTPFHRYQLEFNAITATIKLWFKSGGV
jgi:hypothetical protein